MKFPTTQNETVDYLAHMEDRFEKLFIEYNELYQTRNKRLLDSLTDQLEMELPWERLKEKLHSLVQFIEYNKDQAYAQAITEAMTEKGRMLKLQEAKFVAEVSDEYRVWRKLWIEADSLYRDARGVRETITSRRYILNNITNSVIASMENTIL